MGKARFFADFLPSPPILLCCMWISSTLIQRLLVQWVNINSLTVRKPISIQWKIQNVLWWIHTQYQSIQKLFSVVCVYFSPCFCLSLSLKLIHLQRKERLETCLFWKTFLLAFISWISCPAVSPTWASEKALSLWRQSLSASGRWSLFLLLASLCLSSHRHESVLQPSMDHTGKCTSLRGQCLLLSCGPCVGCNYKRFQALPRVSEPWTPQIQHETRVIPFINHRKHPKAWCKTDVWVPTQLFWFSISWVDSEDIKYVKESTLDLALKHSPRAS